MQFHNEIARLALERFQTLPKTGKPTPDEWTVMSAIIKENCNILEVVSLGTGSKCLGKTSLSQNGDILNDSHAEVMARRGFMRYLYSEIAREAESEIFVQTNRTFHLKSNVKFHFFTTHVPCGDAAIFSKTDRENCGKCLEFARKRSIESDGDSVCKKVKNEIGDIYRTGGKCLPFDAEQDMHLEGAKYHLLGKVRTKPGGAYFSQNTEINSNVALGRGDPTLSVSCSDKLAKWFHVGLQGALLSLLVPQPLRFVTFTITANTPFCETALRRSLFNRLNNYNCNNANFVIGQASSTFDYYKCDGRRPSANSIVWYKNGSESRHEVAVNGRKLGVTKKRKNDAKSHLSIAKIEMFHCFVGIVKQLRLFENVEKLSYCEAKLLASDYQNAWRKLKNEGFKIWTTKDPSLLDFYADHSI